jgi:hypothetical protein
MHAVLPVGQPDALFVTARHRLVAAGRTGAAGRCISDAAQTQREGQPKDQSLHGLSPSCSKSVAVVVDRRAGRWRHGRKGNLMAAGCIGGDLARDVGRQAPECP